MQRVVAYRFERRDFGSDAARAAAIDELEGVVRSWLRSKRASGADAERGTFRSQTPGGAGRFAWQRANAGSRSWRMVELDEAIPGEQRFNSAISITDTGSEVLVYATLSIGAAKSSVAPSARVDPRCPRVLRNILKLSASWHHGESRIDGLSPARGVEMGRVLASKIESPRRTLPILVVTDDEEGELAIDAVDTSLAHELIGLANVFRLDHQAAWGLTEALGLKWSCYYGAVRLYWPGFRAHDPFRWHPRWTPDEILARVGDVDDGAEFVASVRRLIFRAAAVSVQRPTEIDEIRAAHVRAALQSARDQNDFESLAESYANDNERLKARVSELEEELLALKVDLDNVKALRSVARPDAPEEAEEADVGEAGPQPGEIRYYKKVGSTPKRDKMVRVADCGCNKWEGGFKGDKARKGIMALEQQRDDWKNLWHCASCTGGGMWKVKW